MRFAPLLLALALLGIATRAEAQSTDTKSWTKVSADADLVDDLKLDAQLQHRFGFDAGHDKSFGQMALSYDVHEMVRVAAGLRSGLASDGDELNSQFRVFGDAQLRKRYEYYRLSVRARLQTENEAGNSKQTARLRFKGAFRPTKGYEVFSAFEFFYRIDANEFRQHRFTLGFGYPITKDWTGDLAYRFEEEFYVRFPETSHIIALGFHFELDDPVFGS